MRNGTFAYLCKAVALTSMAAFAAAGPGFAADTMIAVSGDSKPSDCGAAKKASYAIEVSGSLSGCWAVFVGHSNCQDMNGFALYTEIGREEFAGKLDGQDTTFDTQYTFTGVFPAGSCPEPAAEKEVVGGCTHYISGKGLVGTVRFYDVMFGPGAPHYFYEGTLAKS
jgi:hypothetical protein